MSFQFMRVRAAEIAHSIRAKLTCQSFRIGEISLLRGVPFKSLCKFSHFGNLVFVRRYSY